MQQTLQNKCATVGNYMLVKTLGKGYNSKVRLCRDLTTNQFYAMKLIKHSNNLLNLDFIRNEITILSALHHPNIVNLIEFNEDAEYIKKNGSSYKVVSIVLELIAGGELFEYLKTSGRFSEPLARTYFHTLIETIEYCHNQGIAHRDLKIENILLDSNFNLKVADFGFSALVCGREENGELCTILGTESYMAPEMHLGLPYTGPTVDLFACGIILFNMVSGHRPFNKADVKGDGHYQLLSKNRADVFWAGHESTMPKEEGRNFYSPDFRHLIEAMFSLEPTVRPTIAEIKAHPWYNGPTEQLSHIREEFANRKKIVDAEILSQRQAKKDKKLADKLRLSTVGNTSFTGIQPYRELELNNSINGLLSSKFDFEAPRTIRPYLEETGYKASSQMFSVLSPNILLKLLSLACKGVLNEFTIAVDKYQIKKGKAIKEEGACKLNIEILKVDDDTYCIEFQRKEGMPWVFFDVVEDIKKRLPKIEVQTEEKQPAGTKLEQKETAI